MSILLVEDDPMMRELLDALLVKGGLGHPLQAESASQAAEMLDLDHERKPMDDLDLILLDILLPDGDGIDLCARIKSDPRFADVPIIIVTSLTDMSYLNMAFIAGAIDYVTKPIQPVALLARARSALRLKQELDRRHAREQALVDVKDRLQMAEIARQRLGTFDELTGLPDRAMLHERARWFAMHDLETHAHMPPSRSLGIALIQIDAFDSYQSHYGEDAGLSLIQQITDALRNVPAPLGDILGRYDEHTFALMAPFATLDQVQATATMLHDAVSALKIDHAYSPTADIVTVRSGVVCRETEADAVETLFRSAETALETAKPNR